MKEKKPAEASPATPMLKQYFEIKAQYPEAILLYRVGDFYETYGDDALKASRLLGIVLTRKSSGGGSFIEMAGIPYHAIDNYLPRLVQAGCPHINNKTRHWLITLNLFFGNNSMIRV